MYPGSQFVTFLLFNCCHCFCFKSWRKGTKSDPLQGPSWGMNGSEMCSKCARVRSSSVSVSSALPLLLRFEKCLPTIFLTPKARILTMLLYFCQNSCTRMIYYLAHRTLCWSKVRFVRYATNQVSDQAYTLHKFGFPLYGLSQTIQSWWKHWLATNDVAQPKFLEKNVCAQGMSGKMRRGAGGV